MYAEPTGDVCPDPHVAETQAEADADADARHPTPSSPFAKAHHDSSVSPPYTSTGGNGVSDFKAPPSDAGDDTARDISDWYLARYCDDTYRLLLATDDAATP